MWELLLALNLSICSFSRWSGSLMLRRKHFCDEMFLLSRKFSISFHKKFKIRRNSFQDFSQELISQSLKNKRKRFDWWFALQHHTYVHKLGTTTVDRNLRFKIAEKFEFLVLVPCFQPFEVFFSHCQYDCLSFHVHN